MAGYSGVANIARNLGYGKKKKKSKKWFLIFYQFFYIYMI